MTGASVPGHVPAFLGLICWLTLIARASQACRGGDVLSGNRSMILANGVSVRCVGTIAKAKLIWGHK